MARAPATSPLGKMSDTNAPPPAAPPGKHEGSRTSTVSAQTPQSSSPQKLYSQTNAGAPEVSANQLASPDRQYHRVHVSPHCSDIRHPLVLALAARSHMPQSGANSRPMAPSSSPPCLIPECPPNFESRR